MRDSFNFQMAQDTKALLKMETLMDLVSSSMLMGLNMRETGRQETQTDSEFWPSLMVADTKGNGWRESIVEKEYTRQQMEQSMMESG